jgi:YHS domain-containing protein
VCGMTIEEEDAVGSWEHDGTTYCFCNESCLNASRKTPAPT